MRREDQLRSAGIGLWTVEEADQFTDQQRMEAGIELIDDQRQASALNVQHRASQE